MKFKFEMQNLIIIEVEATTKEKARMQIVNNIEDYGDRMVYDDCYISDGEETKEEPELF